MENGAKEQKKCCCGSSRTKNRTQDEYNALVHRLNRVEGQIRGIRKMLENNAYCIDIITQVSAANAALNSFTKELLSEHIKTCVINDIKNGKTETADELANTLQRLLK